MRSSIVVTSIVGSLLLAIGCGSDQHGSQDATPPGTPDAPVISGKDAPDGGDAAAPDRQEAAIVAKDSADGPADQAQGLEAPGQDGAAVDGHDGAAVGDLAATDAQAVGEAGVVEAGSNPGGLALSSLPREQAALSTSEQNALANSLSGFAFALWQQLRKDPSTKDNFACSPISISLALGMAYAGAKGNTGSQMKSALQIATDDDVYFRSLNWLDEQLESRADAALKQAQTQASSPGRDASVPDPANYRLHVVNACWGEQTMAFEPPYLDTLATEFGSGVHLADFKNQPDIMRIGINAWVSQETLNRINDLIPAGAIDTTTKVVLVNAIHLKLPWLSPFPGTTPGTFTRADGSTVSVPFMNQSASRAYAEDDTTQAVGIPLAGSAVELVVFLPKATSSLTQLEDSLSTSHAQSLVSSMTWQQVVLTLPKFAFTTASVKLRTALVSLGMTDAFSSAADFTGITGAKPLFISDVVHKAMVGVDEHGVEAAAATAVMLAGSGAPTEPKQMNVNRPFFFGIYDLPTSSWLFLGHVTDPSS